MFLCLVFLYFIFLCLAFLVFVFFALSPSPLISVLVWGVGLLEYDVVQGLFVAYLVVEEVVWVGLLLQRDVLLVLSCTLLLGQLRNCSLGLLALNWLAPVALFLRGRRLQFQLQFVVLLRQYAVPARQIDQLKFVLFRLASRTQLQPCELLLRLPCGFSIDRYRGISFELLNNCFHCQRWSLKSLRRAFRLGYVRLGSPGGDIVRALRVLFGFYKQRVLIVLVVPVWYWVFDWVHGVHGEHAQCVDFALGL